MNPSDTPKQPIHLRLLGLPCLFTQEGARHILKSQEAALLAFLVLQGPSTRSRVAGLLNPDLSTQQAQSNLRVLLFRLKEKVGSDVVTTGPVMELAPHVGHDLASPLSDFDDVALMGAEPLLGQLVYDDGELAALVVAAREYRDRQRWDEVARRAEEHASGQRMQQALALAERLVLELPGSEPAHRRLMRLHYLNGDRAAGLAAFNCCCQWLRSELGLTPDAQTLALAELLERSGSLPVDKPNRMPLTTLRPPRLVGRDKEWAEIETACQLGQVVVLVGEPGVGKSRLAADFVTAKNQPNVFRAYSSGLGVPYGLLKSLLLGLVGRYGKVPQPWIAEEFSRIASELGLAPLGKLEPQRFSEALAEAFVHWTNCGLRAMVVDDLHCADNASLEMLLTWLGLRSHPYVVLTVRANEFPGSLRQWIDASPADAVCEIPIRPLDMSCVAEFADSLAIDGLDSASWAQPLFRHTGGNPQFILETLKSHLSGSGMLGALPPSLEKPAHINKLLDRRLAQLSPGALRLARVAALAGPDFSARLAARVLRIHVLDLLQHWVELEQAQVIAEAALAHDLIREATLRSLPRPIAAALHGAVAQVLEEGKHAPARVAHHWQQAGEWALAAVQFERAARASQQAARPAEALAFWNAAAQCQQNAGNSSQAFQARCSSVEPAIIVQSPDEVQSLVEGLLADSNEATERLDALLAKAKHLSTCAHFERVPSIADEALTLARRIGDQRRELLAANFAGVALTAIGNIADGLAIFESAAAVAREVGDERAQCEFFSGHAYALHSAGMYRDAIVWFQRAIALAQRLGDTNDVAINLGNLAQSMRHLGRQEEALDSTLRARELQLRLGMLKGVPNAVSLLNIGILRIDAGRFADALAALEEALLTVRSSQSTSVMATLEHHMANVFLTVGQPARARQCLTPLTVEASAQIKGRRTIIEFRIAEYSNKPRREHLRKALVDLGPQSTVVDRLGLELAVAGSGDPQECLELNSQIREQAMASGHTSVALTALIRVADAQRQLGFAQDAAESASQAVAEASEARAHDMLTPEFYWLAYRAFDSAGFDVEAREALRVGSEWVKRSLPHVPEAFRDSYLHRSRVVPELMAAAKRRLQR